MSVPQQTIVVQQVHPVSRFFSWLGWTLFGMTAISFLVFICGFAGSYQAYFDTTNGVSEKYFSGAKFASDKIAIISIEGVIMQGEGFVKHQIDRIKDDADVKAIVVRVDSPGGTVTGADYMYHHLKKLREEKGIPVVVSMGSVAASGGYYVAMAVGDQEKSIYAEPTTTTGSIGVIIPHYDVSGLMERFDVKDDSIATHPRKQMLAMTKPVTDDHRKLAEAYIGEAFERFKSIVKEGRPAFRAAPEKLDEVATGEIFSAPKAKAAGLVDELGFVEDAISRAAELAKLDLTATRVVKFEREVTIGDLIGSSSARAPHGELGALLELTSPRAYYLSSTIPALLSTHRAD